MAKQPEGRLQKSIQDHLRRTVGGWWYKVWGGPFTPAGIPDLIGCVHGQFFALEVKTQKKSSQPSEIQLETIQRILDEGGIAAVVRSPQEAEDVINKALGSARRRLRVRLKSRPSSSPLRAAYREDLYKSQGDGEGHGGPGRRVRHRPGVPPK